MKRIMRIHKVVLINGGCMVKIAKQTALIVSAVIMALAVSSTTFAILQQNERQAGVLFQDRDTPPFHAYKGVSIGMTTDEVRTKLGKPTEPSDSMDYYAPSDHE